MDAKVRDKLASSISRDFGFRGARVKLVCKGHEAIPRYARGIRGSGPGAGLRKPLRQSQVAKKRRETKRW